MNKTTEALKLAEEALNAMLTHMGMDEDEWTKPTFDQSRKTLAAIREARAEQSIVLNDPHPPHRLCECTACLEYWTPLPDCDAFADAGKVIAEPVKQEPVAWMHTLEGDVQINNLPAECYGDHWKREPLFKYPPTCAQAARQMRDACISILHNLDMGSAYQLSLGQRMRLREAMEALPIRGEEK